ncbi:MAG: discoidin domain-containing protein, partial [Clostridia bacterium]|nr:discoidin domain-containing protein [Clostridia bacterium]
AALGQAPTNYDIEVSSNGTSGWKKVASSGDIAWRTTANEIETNELTFNPVTVKGVRLKINSANTMWNKMVIRDIDIKG